MTVIPSKKMQFKVKGNSMYPILVEEDIVTVVVFDTYKVDDIVVVVYEEHFMIHRIIQKKLINNKIYYLTKGDNNSFIDRWHMYKNIIGRVVEINNVPV